jgi:hypothetical protein
MARLTATEKSSLLAQAARRRGIQLSEKDAEVLRKAEITLQRWAEWECGDSDNYRSTVVVRDEDTGIPYREILPHKSNTPTRYRIPDRETAALKRVHEMAQRLGFYYFHQTDPRGCALYISEEPLTDSDYNRGIACCR